MNAIESFKKKAAIDIEKIIIHLNNKFKHNFNIISESLIHEDQNFNGKIRKYIQYNLSCLNCKIETCIYIDNKYPFSTNCEFDLDDIIYEIGASFLSCNEEVIKNIIE